jgi:hypothetical protein
MTNRRESTKCWWMRKREQQDEGQDIKEEKEV